MQTIASSDVFTSFESNWGFGSGYRPYPGGETWFIHRWCAPSAAAAAAPMTVRLVTDPAASMYSGAPQSAEVKFVVIDVNRCRVAPQWPHLYMAFPSPAVGAFTAVVPSFRTTCDFATPKELEMEARGRAGGRRAPLLAALFLSLCAQREPLRADPSQDPYGSWSFAMLQILGSGYGANLTGYLLQNAIKEASYACGGKTGIPNSRYLTVARSTTPPQVPLNTTSCGAGFAPAIFFNWFPASSDNVPWTISLIARIFPCAARIRNLPEAAPQAAPVLHGRSPAPQ